MGLQDSLDQFNPTGPVDIAGNDPPLKSAHATAMEELQAEMKLLNWHKLANEAALKAALIRTKSLRDTESKLAAPGGKSGAPANSLQEKAAWMAQVIEEEQRKPLQVSKEFVTAYAASEQRASERLESEVERHIDVLRKLRTRVSERDELKQRKVRYKEAAHELHEERARLAAGTMGGATSSVSVQSIGVHAKSTLTTVINSLDKLVELERRITGLENDSLYDRMGDTVSHPHVAPVHAAEAVPSVLGPRPTELRFTKTRTAASHAAPSKTSYSVKVVGKRGLRGVGGRTAPATIPRAGAALAALKGKGLGSLKGSTCVTGGSRALRRKGEPGAATTAPGMNNAGRNPRDSRGMLPKRAAVTGSYTRVVRQDIAISGWLQQKKTGGRNAAAAAGRGGRMGERQFGSRSMQQFQDLRGQMDKRKDEMRRRLRQGGTNSAPSGTAQGSGTRLPPIGRSASSSAGPGRTRGSSLTRLPKVTASNQQRAVRRAW